ncbi:phage major capsid protein [Aquimarina sp. 2-A2]|uniref:phage major capsid family protein n=1 Tax=Aquimarina sp. 2-A2 TaxID=3382644 RepID=UPI00387F1A6D
MTEEQKKSVEEINTKLTDLKTKMEEAVKNAATPEQVKEAQDALENYKTDVAKQIGEMVSNEDFIKAKEDMAALKNSLEDQKKTNEELQQELASFKESKSFQTIENFKFQKEVLSGIKDSLDDKDNRPFKFEVKAAAFASTAVTGNTQAYREEGIDKMAHRKITLLDVFKRVKLPANHSGTVKYREWDEATTAAVVTAIAEGAAFPESTVKWKESSADLKKIGTSIPVSEEFGKDEATLYDEISDFFRDYVELFEEEQIYKGTNIGDQLNGFYTQAPAYTATAKSFDTANIYDLALDVKEDIGRGKGSKYEADTMVLNMGTVNALRRTKNSTKDYLSVPFAENQAGQMIIAGMIVIESNLVADDEMVVFDSRRGTIFEGDEYEMTTGHVANQFLEDEKTLKARKRMLLRIKTNDTAGYRKVASISAALTTLESTPI